MTDLKPKKIGENEYQIDADSSLGMKVPVTIYADETLLQKMMTDRTLKQAINVSTLPGIQEHAVVLPDGHEGYGFPVGGVAAMDAEEGMISPGGVGYDINCGVRLLRTNLTEEQVRPKLGELVNDLFKSIPSGVGSKGAVRLTQSELDDYLELGFFIGLTGWICDERRNVELRKSIKNIPTDRLMIETDCPYLIPRNLENKPKNNRNEPSYLPHIAKEVADLMNMEASELSDITFKNSMNFFN